MDIDEFLNAESGKFDKSAAPKAVIKAGEESNKDSPLVEQIDKLRELLQRNKYKEAGDLYLEAKQKFAQITKQHIEEKTFIHDELADINEKLTVSINQQLLEMNKNKEIIEGLLQRGELSLQQKDIMQAEAILAQVEALFKNIPEIFTEQHLTLENKMLSLKSRVSLEKTKKTISEFESKKREIEVLLDQAFNNINIGRLDLAKKVYLQINKLYESLPVGFIYDKLMLYKRMLKIYHEAELSLELKALQVEEKLQASISTSVPRQGIAAPSPMQAPQAPKVMTQSAAEIPKPSTQSSSQFAQSASAAPRPSTAPKPSAAPTQKQATKMKMPPLPTKK